MPWTLVNKTAGDSVSSGASITTTGLSVSAGNLIVVPVATGYSTARTFSTITDTAGNTYHWGPPTRFAPASAWTLQFAYAYNVSANGSDQVTVTLDSAVSGFIHAYVLQFAYTGGAADPFRNEPSGGSALGSGTSTGAWTPTAGDLIVSLAVVIGATGDFSSSDVTIQSNIDDATSEGSTAVGTNLNAAGGSTTITWTSTRTGSDVAVIAAAFNPGSGGGGVSTTDGKLIIKAA